MSWSFLCLVWPLTNHKVVAKSVECVLGKPILFNFFFIPPTLSFSVSTELSDLIVSVSLVFGSLQSHLFYLLTGKRTVATERQCCRNHDRPSTKALGFECPAAEVLAQMLFPEPLILLVGGVTIVNRHFLESCNSQPTRGCHPDEDLVRFLST